MVVSWFPRTFTFCIWVVAALCATFWGLRFTGSSARAVALPPMPVSAPDGQPADLAKVFGPPVVVAPVTVAVAPKAPDPSLRFALLGVVADRGKGGVALVSVDGKTPRPYRVGSSIDDSFVLKAVSARSATLAPVADADTTFTLELSRATSPMAAPNPGGAPSPNPNPNAPPPSVPGAAGASTAPAPPSTGPAIAPPLRSLRPPRSPESAI